MSRGRSRSARKLRSMVACTIGARGAEQKRSRSVRERLIKRSRRLVRRCMSKIGYTPAATERRVVTIGGHFKGRSKVITFRKCRSFTPKRYGPTVTRRVKGGLTRRL